MHSLGMPLTNVFHVTLANASLFLGGIAMVNLVGIVIFTMVLRAVRMEPPPIAQDLLVAIAYIGVAIATLSYAGVNLQGLIATSAVLTAVIGFSLQDSLGNIMGGMMLQIERTIHVGDWIKVDDVEGRVREIRWRQTSVETRDWDTIVIPNSTLMKSKVTLLGRRTSMPVQRRRWVYFRVGIAHPPTLVMHTVETALRAEANRYIAADPKPQCLITDYKEGDAVYAARYWLTDLSQPDPTDSLVRSRIYAALQRAGVALASPSQSVLLTHHDESHGERKENEEMERRRDALERLDFFRTLTQEERGDLVPRLMTAHFLRGEVITRQGAEAHWLYIIAEGEADVEVAREGKTLHDGESRKVATLHAGDVFGEMGLLTGEPRTASVIAVTEVTCYRLGKEAFVDIIRSRPEVVEQISTALAHRRVELEAVREQLGADAKADRIRAMQGKLLTGIRQFFSVG
jgi:small-conductance mechanosensitive channel/CRP-like cAMP-binding protein